MDRRALEDVLAGHRGWAIVNAKVADALPLLPERCAAACLCDPPYGLGSRQPKVNEIVAYLTGAAGLNTGGDFMSNRWQVPSVHEWSLVARALKPGAHLLAFGGTRMFDLIALGLRAAEFEIFDTISWNYAEGMPKPATTTDKLIDKHLGGGNSRVYADSGGVSRYYFSRKVSPAEREYGCEHLPIRSAADCTKRSKEATRGPQAGAGRTDGYRNFHPTVKPIDLNRWLANLLKPPTPDALLIVPWSGSGSEMIGALLAGWPRVIGIEMQPEFCEIAEARITAWLARGDRQDVASVERERMYWQRTLFGEKT